MFTLVLVALLGVSFLCSLILLAAMIVASRASARTIDSFERLQHIAQTERSISDEIGVDPEAIAAMHATTLVAHRNIAEDLRTHKREVRDEQSVTSAESLLANSTNIEQPEQQKNQA
ncbi:MAG: hypothetical protein R3A44_26815 [Caldilineaceae bacterium]